MSNLLLPDDRVIDRRNPRRLGRIMVIYTNTALVAFDDGKAERLSKKDLKLAYLRRTV